VYERKIVGFRQDKQDDWVADLEGGHTQQAAQSALDVQIVGDDGRGQAVADRNRAGLQEVRGDA